jgi:hypothetical protein
MKKTAAIFWPGDYRTYPNDIALSTVRQVTVQMEAALRKVGWSSYRVDGYLTRPHEAIEKLAPIEDPLVGIYAHWVYAPHTTPCCSRAISRDDGRGWSVC